MNRNIHRGLAGLLLALILPSLPVAAAEIKASFPGAMRAALSELIPQFEKTSGHKITPFYGSVGAIVNRLNSGEASDLVVVSDEALAELVRQGQVVADGGVTIAVVGIGVFMRKGAVKPDIGSVDALRKTLLSAKAIVYADPALGDSSAIFVGRLLERLGIAAEMRPRTKLVGSRGKIDAVANGDAEIGFDQMTNVALDSRVEPIGPLPAELRNPTRYVAGVVTGTTEQEAVKALIAFLTTPASRDIMGKKGVEAF